MEGGLLSWLTNRIIPLKELLIFGNWKCKKKTKAHVTYYIVYNIHLFSLPIFGDFELSDSTIINLYI